MKYILLVLSLLIVGCVSTVDSPPIKSSSVEITCIHKYDQTLRFTYSGQVIAHQKIMFGETIFIYEFTQLDGTKKRLVKTEFMNYICLKQ